MEGSNNNNNKGMLERRARPQKDQALNCPRCNSTNTKFCYYNNYSLSQPRFFCKTCRRYWTEGGSLRNVPVGGGSRKNKRSSSSSSTSSSANLTSSSSLPIPSSANKVANDHDHHDLSLPLSFPTHHHHHQSASQNPKIFHQGQDLNLAYPPSSDHLHPHHQDYDNMMISGFVQVPYTNTSTSSDNDHHNKTSHVHQNPSTTTTTTTTTSSSVVQLSAMELLKTGMASRGLMNSFIAMPAVLPDSNTTTMFSGTSSTSGFSLAQEFKPNSSLSFDLDNHGYNHHDQQSGFGSGLHHHGVQQEISGGRARLLFPKCDQDLKQVSTTTTTSTTRGQGDHNSNATGYWNGMLGGGSW